MRICWLGLLATVGCTPAPPVLPTAAPAAKRLAIPGIENTFLVTPTLYSGGAPEGQEDFKELQKLGIRTVISVDGTSPDVESAKNSGMKYVHLPVGYDGIKTPIAYKIAKAVQSSSGPVYIHCHHGLHRGPTAVAVVRLCLEPDYTPADALAWMTQAGTDAKYKGLFRMPSLLIRPTPEQLAGLPADFPEKAELQDLTQVMVHTDVHWDVIRSTRGREWLGADSAAILLAEDFREAKRTLTASTKGDEFNRLLMVAETTVGQFAEKVKSNQLNEASELFEKIKLQCSECHTKYRD